MPTSQNGWPASKDAASINITQFPVYLQSGKPTTIRLAADAGEQLVQMIEWWDQNIEPVVQLGGYNYREIRGKEGTGKLSNHSSGTAIDINWDKHPFTVRGTLPPEVIGPLRAKAASLGLKWGGDWKRADEMHFEIIAGPAANKLVYTNAALAPIAGAVAETGLPVHAVPAAVGVGTASAILVSAIAYVRSEKNKRRNAAIGFLLAGGISSSLVLLAEYAASNEGD